MGVREAWGGEEPGRHSAAGPPSLSEPATPSHQTLFRAQASPPLPVGKAGIWGTGRRQLGGQAEACPLKENPALSTPAHTQHPHQEYPSGGQPQGTTGRVRGRDGGEREKILEEEVCTHSHILSVPTLPTHCSIATAILEAGGLGQRQGSGHWGFSVTRVLGGRWDGGWEQGGGTLSQSLPLQALSMPAAHPILKAHGSQTSPHLLYPNLTLHTEQLDASEKMANIHLCLPGQGG